MEELEYLTQVKLKDLKKGELFTRKPVMYPKECQVFIRDDYEKSEKKYYCIRFSDMNDCLMLKGNTIVYIGFTF